MISIIKNLSYVKMKKLRFIAISLLCFSCWDKPGTSNEAQLWGAEKISTEAPEFATAVNRREDQVYFNRTAKDRSTMQIMHSIFTDSGWSAPVALPFSTGLYRDVDPFLTTNGQRLYFSSDRPLNSDGEPGNFDTWYIEKSKEGWSDPINAGATLNSGATEIFITLAKNKNAYFVSEDEEERGIVVSRYEDGDYQPPEKVVLKLRGNPIYASNPCIASDESFLIVAARDPLGNGTPDLFITWNENGQWSELKNLGTEVNSMYADFAPGLSKDNKYLFFTSERPGIVPIRDKDVRPPGDIYKVNLKAILADLK